ncbi:pyridoxal phosphate-dependent transferase [Aspergillus californicus]
MDNQTNTVKSLEKALVANIENVAWGTTHRAEADFRSDVITTPSLGMLAAMANTSLGDDVFEEDETTTELQSFIATLCGHEAGAFVISGTMANQLSIRTLLAQPPPYGVLVDAGSHIINFEGGGVGMSGASIQAVPPSNGRYLVLEDIQAHAVITDNVHKCPTRVICMENTAGGSIVPLTEVRRISEWAHGHGIRLHMDGARLWEAVAAGAGSLQNYCSICDLVSLDFSKNLGAPMGAMVLGSTRLIAQLRRVRKSLGGGMRQSGPLAAAARHAVAEQFGDGPWGSKDKLRAVHVLAKRVGAMWIESGGELRRDVETNHVWLNLNKAGIDTARWNEIGKRHGVKLDGGRVVLHHQISTEAVVRLGLVFHEALKIRPHL